MLRTFPRNAFRPLAAVRFSHAVTEVQSLSHFDGVLANEKKATVVDFYATWCGPCKAISPIFDKLAEKVPEAQFARVDVDQAQDVAQEWGITAMPTILFFQNGVKVDKIIGADPNKLAQLVSKYTE